MSPEEIAKLKAELAAAKDAEAEAKAVNDSLSAQVKTATEAEAEVKAQNKILAAEAKAAKDAEVEAKAVNEALSAQVKTATETAKAGGVKTKKIGEVTYKIPYPSVNHKGTIITAEKVAKEKNEDILAEYIEFGILVK
ncbi:hypothetical protein [Emticicia sp.]|uniref:hypothetical protein n=1 Tax=Emticicia sp. TaxID=1930953 RepID=UPI0037502A2F